MLPLRSAFLLSAALYAGTSCPLRAGTIWVEGEAPAASTMHRHPWFDQVKTDALSGGAWISNFSKQEGTADYKVDVPEAGDYTLWVRAVPTQTKLSWALDKGEWQAADLRVDRRGEQNIAADNKPDLRFIAWSKVGRVKLEPGSHSVRWRTHGTPDNHGGIDCFVLTSDGFIPNGLNKPGANAGAADANDVIWIEGEAPSSQTVTRHPWWYDQVKKDVLSGGDWISHFDEAKAGTADYEFTAPKADTWAFWVRANPVASALEWKLDDSAWTEVNFKDGRGQQNIAADNKPDLRFLAWVKAGDVKLTAGKHAIAFRFTSKNSHHGGLDCFVLTRIPFVPNGAQKPGGAAAGGGPADWFPLLADDDTFEKDSVIDMSGLIEAPAGKYGPLQADGSRLKFARGTGPVKFWGVNAGAEQSRNTVEQNHQRARYLRKFGVNIARQHPLFDEISEDGRIDPKKLDAYDRWFADLKESGIYTNWSIFYHFPVRESDGYPAELFGELEPMGRSGLRDTYGLAPMSEKIWEIRTKVMIALLDHKNPYTGLRYADDPALAVVEFQNEDCIFFWNPLGDLSSASPKKWKAHAKLLRQMWCAWVKTKYSTDGAVKAAWGKLDGESLASGELKLMGPWELDGSGIRGAFAGQTKRAGDQIRFLSEMQRRLYENCEKAVRATGYKGMTVTTNWQAGSNLLEQANLWTDTAASMIDRHSYAGGGAGGHGINEGVVRAESHLGKPGSLLFEIGMKQVEDRPFSMTEWTMSPPNRWKLEAAPLFAFYGMGLQGWDSSCHFAQTGTRLNDGWPGQSSYASDTPHYIGQFPALAFALHKGHIKEAPVVAARRTTADGLFTGKPAWREDFSNGDQVIAAEDGTPREVFAMGRVTAGFSDKPSETADLSKFWNKQAKTITSATGELAWDYGTQVVTLRAPKTQAVIGRAGGKKVVLPGVSVDCRTEFVSVIFTPLDDAPLAESKHILITALAQDKQTGARYSEDGSKLESVGTAPLLLEPVQATLKFAGPASLTVRPLDHYGMPRKTNVAVAADGTFVIDGTHRAYYYEVRR